MVASSERQGGDRWVMPILGGMVMLDPSGRILGWIGSVILGGYLVGITAWLLFNRRRFGRWISWGGRELYRADLLFIALIVATFATIAIIRPLGLFSLWASIATLPWVLGLCIAYEHHQRAR